MATPRKHWFRVADSVAHEPWSNDVCATFVRLLAHLNTRWAREGRTAEEACHVVLSRGTAMQLTGSGSLARARSILRELATHVTLVIDEQGANTSVRWPKFAEFQRLESEHGAALKVHRFPALPSPQSAPAPAPARLKTTDPQPPRTVAAAPAIALNGTHREDLRASIRAVWPRCQAAASRHGRRWGKLTESRVVSLAARLKDFGPDPEVLVRAIDGAVAYWRSSAPKDADHTRHLVPETVYRPSTFPKYLEATEDPKTAPRKRVSEMNPEEIRELQRRGGINV